MCLEALDKFKVRLSIKYIFLRSIFYFGTEFNKIRRIKLYVRNIYHFKPFHFCRAMLPRCPGSKKICYGQHHIVLPIGKRGDININGHLSRKNHKNVFNLMRRSQKKKWMMIAAFAQCVYLRMSTSCTKVTTVMLNRLIRKDFCAIHAIHVENCFLQ